MKKDVTIEVQMTRGISEANFNIILLQPRNGWVVIFNHIWFMNSECHSK